MIETIIHNLQETMIRLGQLKDDTKRIATEISKIKSKLTDINAQISEMKRDVKSAIEELERYEDEE